MKESSDASLPVVVNIGNFKYDGGFRFESTRVQRYSGEFPDSFMLASGDLLLVMTCQTAGGEILGIPGRIPNDGTIYLHNQRMGRVEITRPDELDLSYLYYLFLSKTFNQHLVATSTGSKILHTAPGRIEDFTWQRPPVEEQRRIAAVLSAYDDLIENNARRIRVLEEMARALYREWFVQFRYPGHTQGTTGLPAGWEKGTLATLATYARDSITPNEEPDTEFDLLSFEACDEGRIPIVTKGVSILSNKFRVSDGAVLLPKLNPHIPRVWLPFLTGARPPICSTEYMVLSPRPGIPRTYIYATVEGVNFSAAVAARADGTSNSHKRLKPDDVMNRPVVKPPRALLEEFDAFAASAYEACDKLRRKNTRLRAARDLLLPKLLSGQLSVERIPDPAEVAG